MKVNLVPGTSIDLTQTVLEGMTIYPGDPSPKINRMKTLEKDHINLSSIEMGSHTGTHIDAPLHFVQGGVGADRLSPEQFVGEAVVLDLSSLPAGSGIKPGDLEKYDAEVREGAIILLYTGLSKHWGEPWATTKFTYLTGSAAAWLVSRKVRAVGIDYLSVEEYGAKDPIAHMTLLKNGIPIIESLNANLGSLLGKRVFLVCLFVKLKDGDGAPARVIAFPLG